MKHISLILKKYNISSENTITFGNYLSKIKPILKQPKNNKLILVTAISPTPAGEGKTTVSIGLNDALNKIKVKSIVALREPSMGPVFGVKGGANGGGKAQVVPKDDIDLHFTGDFHAITAANNLISACIDNHIYWGNELQIDLNNIIWRRVLDVNDRALREIEVVINPKKNIKYKTGFDITVASELMAIFCLSNNVEEMQQRINNIIVAYSIHNKPIYVRDFNITNALMKILHNALWPNAVQSLEGNLALIHGGPFANIAHGCNSLIATKTAMNISDYTVTEAGFGSDLGAEKFLDIVCDNGKIKPSVVVLVASVRSLKMHGGSNKDELNNENITTLNIGLENLRQHIANLKAFGIPIVVAINQFANDTKNELSTLANFFNKEKVAYSFTTVFKDGSKGAIDLAKKVVSLSKQPSKLIPVYNKTDSIQNKIMKIVKRCYGASGVIYSQKALDKLQKINNSQAWICMAKTPLTFSDDPKEIIIKGDFQIHVQDIVIANGANFIIVLTGDIFRMPGLPKVPSACKM